MFCLWLSFYKGRTESGYAVYWQSFTSFWGLLALVKGPRSPLLDAFSGCLDSKVPARQCHSHQGCLLSLACVQVSTYRVVGRQPLDIIQSHIDAHHAQDQLVLGAGHT